MTSPVESCTGNFSRHVVPSAAHSTVTLFTLTFLSDQPLNDDGGAFSYLILCTVTFIDEPIP